MGGQAPFFVFFGCLCAVSAVAIKLGALETRGRTLEDIERHFLGDLMDAGAAPLRTPALALAGDE